MDDKLIRLARKVKTLEDELNRISKIKDLDGLLLANSDMSSRYRKSIAETVGMYKDYISNTKKELQDSLKAIQKEQTEKHTANKKNIDNLEAKLNKVKDDILNVSTSINKSIEDIQKDILKDIKDKNNQILVNLDKKDKELKEVKKENTALNKDLKALKALVEKLELQKGDDGKSAYDIACELGFKGTKEEWIKSLHGKDGQDIELRGLRAFSDVKNDNKMYARKNKKWVEVENYDDTEIREDIADIQDEQTTQNNEITALQTENTRLKATLPTTTGEGENITLSNTAELEFIQPPLPRGNSEQADITDNLFDNTWESGDIDGTSGNNYTGSGSIRTTNYIRIYPNHLFTISRDLTTGYNKYRFYDINKQFISGQDSSVMTSDKTDNRLGNGQSSMTFTITNTNIAYMRVVDNSTNTNIKYTLTTASINPDYPSAISNVTGDVEVLVQNKNLLDEDTVTFVHGIIDDNGNISTSSSSHYTNNFYAVKPNIDYTLSGTLHNTGVTRIYYYNKKKEWISRTEGSQSNTITFVTPSECYYIRIQVTENITLKTGDVQLEQGSTATTYTPHQEQTLPLTLGNIELCKIGTVQDYFYKENNKWYLYKAIEKLVLNGSEEWNVWNLSSEINQRFYSNLDVSKASLTDNVGTMLCNRFQVVRSTSADIEHYTFSATASHYSQPLIIINRSRLSTVDVAGFKTWLSSNNVIVYYQLEIPTSTEITDTTLIEQLDAILNAISYEEQTNISGSSDESNPLFSVEAYQSIKLVLAS